ncbi:RUS1 family protein homolog [Mycetomoellerius zeteki]|uniref:RUS1 family protein homolog n=1 Tax=Mycetomoellerius zeteki TaxID=64791 RepID=UPI00084EAA4F|nr:PREDICTED: RUS1 family protein homolog [Trachymyrmex zeteki]
MTFTCLSILWAALVVLSAQMDSLEQLSLEDEQFEPIIENKNVNINVNVNAQELAQELWKIMETRLNNRTIHITNSKSIKKDLERAVIPLVSHNRRDGTSPSVFQVATQLDKIARRAIIRDSPSINMLDEEIMARGIVADMMASTKMTLSKQTYPKTNQKKDSFSRRMLQRSDTKTMSNDDEQNYVNNNIPYLAPRYYITPRKLKLQKKNKNENENMNANINENLNSNIDTKRHHRRSFNGGDSHVPKMRNQNTNSNVNFNSNVNANEAFDFSDEDEV